MLGLLHPTRYVKDICREYCMLQGSVLVGRGSLRRTNPSIDKYGMSARFPPFGEGGERELLPWVGICAQGIRERISRTVA